MISYLSLFSGIGAFEKAMKNLKIPFELIGFSEIDKYASKSYSEIHNISEQLNFWDITKIDEKILPQVDFITYGFPCQDISIAGKQQGLFNDDGTKTRSGLFFDALRIIEWCKPKVAIAENVKNLTSKKFNAQFQVVLESLEQAGYNNYYQVLNSKDYGIPQNRERVFIISIRKDVDTGLFEFPEPYELKLRLKDMLENEVDEKYYVNSERAYKLIQKLKSREVKRNPEGVDVVGDLWEDNGHGSMAGRVYNTEGQCPTLGASHFQQIKYILEESGMVISCGNVNPSGRGQNGSVIDSEGLARTITIEKGEGQKILTHSPLRIRKLTPKECFRLQGFDDESFHKAEAVCSNTQLYKQAGNSITVDVAEELLCMLFDEEGNFFI
jgi:DNA (cytosine-5)-methyltransferase 1